MKKRILSVVLAAFMAATLLTACGDSKETSAPTTTTQTQTQESATQEETKTETTDSEDNTDAISDEGFEALQDCYAAMVDHYNAVQELYTLDEIAADADIEEIMNEAADIINEMGEITQDSITNDDALALIDAMEDITDALTLLAENMELVDGTGEMVSDENFAILQENYGVLVDTYNAVADAYNSGAFEADADFETAMNEAADVIEEMGTIEQDSLSEEDAETLNEYIIEILNVLGEVNLDVG